MPASAAPFCSRCGTGRVDDQRFCTRCGQAYSFTRDPGPGTSGPWPRVPTASPPATPAPGWSQPPKAPRRPWTKIDLLLVACLLLSLAVSATLWAILLTDEDPPTSVTGSASSSVGGAAILSSAAA